MKNLSTYSTDELRAILYEKAADEQKIYISRLKSLTPEQIIESSYEKVIRDDILSIFENEDISREQTLELLKLKEPLADCYARWLHNDYSHMEMLRDTIEEFANDLFKQSAQKKKSKNYQPER